MYKIMVVDDELAIRKGLVNLVPWSSVECEVVCEAVNGIDAIKKLKSCSPDIIITDIKMPGLNGIELAKHVSENYPTIKTIILTGYADFSYAQSALKYGTLDFVLKPTEPEQLLEAVNKAKAIILQQNQRESILSALEAKVDRSLVDLREKLIHDIIDGLQNDRGTISNQLNELGIPLQQYYILVYEIENITNKSQETNSEENGKFTANIKNFLSLAFKDYTHIILSIQKYRLCSVVSFEKTSTDESLSNILEICGEILRIVGGFMSFSVSIGISNSHSDPMEISLAYSEGEKALSSKFYSDKDSNTSIYSTYINSLSRDEIILTNSYLDRILRCIKEGNRDELQAMITGLFEKLREERQSIDYIKNIGIQLCASFEILLSSCDISISRCMQDRDSIYKTILESKTVVQLCELLSTTAFSVSERLNLHEKQTNILIKKVQGFISSNYKNPISLQMLSDYVHINGSYLSRLFKKETNDTITDAIIKVRIEKAKELLLKTDLKTYEVAAEVGIDDPAYFSVIFKKYTGISPKDYARTVE